MGEGCASGFCHGGMVFSEIDGADKQGNPNALSRDKGTRRRKGPEVKV